MIEIDGELIRVVTGLSGATYNSALAPMKPTTLEDFLKPQWKGKIASTPYCGRLRCPAGRGRLGQGEDRRLVRALLAADHRR